MVGGGDMSGSSKTTGNKSRRRSISARISMSHHRLVQCSLGRG